jgi:agarase
MRRKATGFFRTEQVNGVWWFVDPDGHLFISKGVNHVSFGGDYCPALGYSPYNRNVQAKYGSEEKWAEATAKRLREWDFNTIGAWSSASLFQLMPYTAHPEHGRKGWGRLAQRLVPGCLLSQVPTSFGRHCCERMCSAKE